MPLAPPPPRHVPAQQVPRSIATPPPPPSAPPASIRGSRSLGRHDSARSGRAGRKESPARARSPCAAAPQRPAYREQVLNKLLKGLEEDSLTVADVLGVLETELRQAQPNPSGAPSISAQMERYIGPLAEISSPSGPGRPTTPQRLELAKRGPEAAQALATGGGGSVAVGGTLVPAAPPTQAVVLGCARCEVLEQQVRAMAQALAGIGARMFNWSLSSCVDAVERQGLWHVLLKYIRPCASVDARIAETVNGLQAALGAKSDNIVDEVLEGSHHRAAMGSFASVHQPSLGKKWQPHTKGPIAVGIVDRSAPPSGEIRSMRLATDQLHQATLPSETPNAIVVSPAQVNAASNMVAEVTVSFGASQAAKRLSGVYVYVRGVEVNGRPIYKRGLKHLVHLDDGTWVIKDGPGGEDDADVYAYVQDNAREPQGIREPWNVADDGDGFVSDARGRVTPGRSAAHADAAVYDLPDLGPETE